MQLKWTSKALADLARLYDFLATVNKKAAARTVQSLTNAPTRLLEQPYIGEKLEEFEPREVRRILIGRYEMDPLSIYCGCGTLAKIDSHAGYDTHERNNLCNFTKDYFFFAPTDSKEMVCGWLSIKISGK